MIGRKEERTQALSTIQKQQNLLIKGDAGIGKSTLLHHLSTQVDRPVLTINGTSKQALIDLAEQVHHRYGLKIPADVLPAQTLKRAQRSGALAWAEVNRPIGRLKIPELATIVCNSLKGHDALLCIDSLEVPPQMADVFLQLTQVIQTIACMDSGNRRDKIKKLSLQFAQTIELKPLPLSDCDAIAYANLESVRFSSENVKWDFIRHIARECHGNPSALVNLCQNAKGEDEITPAKIRSFNGDGAAHYFDMSWVVVLVLIIFMAWRYVSRGMSEIEAYVLSGVGSAVMFGAMYILRQLATPRKKSP